VDLGEASHAVVDQSVALARAIRGDVRLLHVAAPDPDFVGYGAGPASVRDAVARGLRVEHRQLEELAQRFTDAGVHVTPSMLRGSTAETIVEQAQRSEASLVVLGVTGRRRRGPFGGGVAEKVIREVCLPVLLVPAPTK
jgi:nucleotide-binding universal stress UspA family protein